MQGISRSISSIAKYVLNSHPYVREKIVETICKMYEERLLQWESGSLGFPYKLEKVRIYATEKTKKAVKDNIESIRKQIMEEVTKEVESGKWDVSVVVVGRSIEYFKSQLIKSFANLYSNEPFIVFQEGGSIDFLRELMTKIVEVAYESKSVNIAEELMRFYLAREDRSSVYSLNQVVMDKLKESQTFRNAVAEVAAKQLQKTPTIASSLGMIDVLSWLVEIAEKDDNIFPTVLPAWVDAVVKVRSTRSYDYIISSFSKSSVSGTDEGCAVFVKSLIHSVSMSESPSMYLLRDIVDTSKEVFNVMVKHNISSKLLVEFYEWVASLSTLLSVS